MDKNASKINFEFLDSSRNFIYDARETGKTHTSFQYEIVLFTAIRNGDIQGVKMSLELYQKSGLIIGHMSNNPLREIHYWAVATIAIFLIGSIVPISLFANIIETSEVLTGFSNPSL